MWSQVQSAKNGSFGKISLGAESACNTCLTVKSPNYNAMYPEKNTIGAKISGYITRERLNNFLKAKYPKDQYPGGGVDLNRFNIKVVLQNPCRPKESLKSSGNE